MVLVPRMNGFWGCVALRGGPPLVSGRFGSLWAADRPTCERFPGPPVVVRFLACAGRGLGSATRHRGHDFSSNLCPFAAVDDDLFDLTCRVSPSDQLV